MDRLYFKYLCFPKWPILVVEVDLLVSCTDIVAFKIVSAFLADSVQEVHLFLPITNLNYCISHLLSPIWPSKHKDRHTPTAQCLSCLYLLLYFLTFLITIYLFN